MGVELSCFRGDLSVQPGKAIRRPRWALSTNRIRAQGGWIRPLFRGRINTRRRAVAEVSKSTAAAAITNMAKPKITLVTSTLIPSHPTMASIEGG